MNIFADEVVLITGVASGIGAATARAFLREGATVVGADINTDALDAFVRDTDTLGAERFHPVKMDVSSTSSVESAVAEATRITGAINVVFNNAGIAPIGSALETDDELWRTIMAVDLDGVFRVARATLPSLIESGGALINTASVSGLGADYNYAAYNAAKGAVVNLTRSLAIDYGKRGVRVNAIAPGPIRTPMLEKNVQALPGLEQSLARFIPLGRIGEPDEIASVVLFLASPAASFINGAIIPIDGGVTAWNGQPNGDLLTP